MRFDSYSKHDAPRRRRARSASESAELLFHSSGDTASGTRRMFLDELLGVPKRRDCNPRTTTVLRDIEQFP